MPTHDITPAGVTDTGNIRSRNEDHLLAAGDLFAVADGMGGYGHGDRASQTAVEALHQTFTADPTEEGLLRAVQVANQAVRAQAAELADGRPMGTTLAAVARVHQQGQDLLVVVNVGDSRVYLFRHGELRRLSVDHSVVDELVRAGSLSEDEALTHHQRHVLTQAVGVADTVEPAVTHLVPEAGDRLLLCSDGLFTEVGHDQLVAVLGSEADPEHAASRLVAEAKANGGRDNITALVLDLS